MGILKAGRASAPGLHYLCLRRNFGLDRRRLGILQAGLASALGLHYLCGKIRIMARKIANYPLVEGLEITTLAAEGKAMGRWNDVVVFVPLTVPGDVGEAQRRALRRLVMEGVVGRYVK